MPEEPKVSELKPPLPAKPSHYMQAFKKAFAVAWGFCVIVWRYCVRHPLLVCICAILILATALLLVSVTDWQKRVALKSELDSMKLERDAYARQLAPFTSIANRQYPRSRPKARIDILAKEVAIVAQRARAAAATAAALPQNEILSPEAVDRIRVKLDFADHVSVRIVATNKETGTVVLAARIMQAFRASGWDVTGVDLLNNYPSNGVTVTTKKPIKPPLNDALKQMFTEIGQEPSIKTGKGLSDADMEITVGSKDSGTAQQPGGK